MTSRADHIRMARAFLHEAGIRRRQGHPLWFTLMTWARNARIRAAATRPAQGELFSNRSTP